jgi:hypothetical protein
MPIKTTLLATATGIALLLIQPVHAGGPVLTEDAYEAEADRNRNGWIVPVLGILLIGALIAGGGSDAPDVKPGPVC